MTTTHTGKRPWIAALALAALLAACHHSDDDTSAAAPVSGSPSPGATDAFVSYVSQVAATQSDTAEPASTDGVTVTMPDDTEPQALPGP